jgi:hypothetical protein
MSWYLFKHRVKYNVISNYVNDYINLLVRIVHIICNHRTFEWLGEVCLRPFTYIPFFSYSVMVIPFKSLPLYQSQPYCYLCNRYHGP